MAIDPKELLNIIAEEKEKKDAHYRLRQGLRDLFTFADVVKPGRGGRQRRNRKRRSAQARAIARFPTPIYKTLHDTDGAGTAGYFTQTNQNHPTYSEIPIRVPSRFIAKKIREHQSSGGSLARINDGDYVRISLLELRIQNRSMAPIFCYPTMCAESTYVHRTVNRTRAQRDNYIGQTDRNYIYPGETKTIRLHVKNQDAQRKEQLVNAANGGAEYGLPDAARIQNGDVRCHPWAQLVPFCVDNVYDIPLELVFFMHFDFEQLVGIPVGQPVNTTKNVLAVEFLNLQLCASR